MTVVEFESLGLPEDSSLMLINGIVYDESGVRDVVTKRNRHHARIELLVGYFLEQWVKRSNFPGTVFSGEVGCILAEEGLSVGIDVAVFSNETLSNVAQNSPYITGAPVLAVEILSPSDQIESIESKVEAYLAADVHQVWLISPRMRNVTVYIPDQTPRVYTSNSVIDGGDSLPGLAVPVVEILE